MATTCPPVESGGLVKLGEADGGKGFRLTGEGVLLLLVLDV